MSWRTVVISNRCKLDLKLGYMVVRSEEIKRIHMDEISVIIIENTAVSLTCCLLNEISKRKIKLIFCDEHRNPTSELVSLYGSFDTSLKLRMQLNWDEGIKASVWTVIVSEKIRNQMKHLYSLGLNNAGKLLEEYIDEIEFNDSTNREGHSAKVYFNAIFGKDFSRNEENTVNAALNYGYSIILSAINREITANGYLTQIGLFHDNMFNQFNLGCDLMEPFRILVDRYVVKQKYNVFETEEKHNMIHLLESQVIIDNSKQFLMNAIKIYCKSVFEALNSQNTDVIKFFEVE